MITLIEISALLAGLIVFVLVTVLSWMFARPRRRRVDERFVPGNYHPHVHGDGFVDHSS